MITISLCMIVKNEEEVLERCLDSVKDLVDEINIVDTGSTDKTVEIAKNIRTVYFSLNGQENLKMPGMNLLNMQLRTIYYILMRTTC